jgi:hypothetical protein
MQLPKRNPVRKQPGSFVGSGDQLLFAIGFALIRSRDLLREIVRQHVTEDARRELGRRVVQHLERQGFEVDEEGQTLRRRPPGRDHGRLRLHRIGISAGPCRASFCSQRSC